jgi:iron complex outermembrane receptor protein
MNVYSNSRVANLSIQTSCRRWNFRRSLLGCAAISVALLTQPALADEAAAAASADSSPASALGDIVVTAQHREENVQTTPIALSVFSGNDLRKAGISDISTLAASSPDVSFTQSEGKPVITIRGVSSRDTTENGDPAVTVNVDGFYLNRPYSLKATMYDLDRVEILRGPQGTLNGRNSVGGAVNIVTAKPTDKFEGYASVAYGNYNDLETQGAINIPVSDQIQVRASFFSESRDGYRHLSNGSSADDADNKTGRLQVAFQPTDRLHGLVTLEYTKMGGVGDGMQNISFVYDDTGALVHDMPAGIDSKNFDLKTKPSLDMTEKQIRGNLGYDFDTFTVTLLGGYDSTEWHHATDQSTLYDDSNVYQFQENQYPKTANAELRFASKNKSRFQWQFGGFFFQEKSHLLSVDATPLANGGYNDYFGFAYKTKAQSEALYAQASYDLTDSIKVMGGARYTHDKKSESGYYGNFSSDPDDYAIYANQTGSAKFSKTTFHAEIDDKLTPTNFVYAKFDTGYKAGGFNFGGSSYKPETIQSWELGSKNRFLDDQLQVNLAAYYSNYSNQQVSNYAYLASGDPVQLTQNAGASHIYGLEGEFIYNLPQIVKANLSVNWLHARYTEFISIADPTDPQASGNVDLAGNRPPQSPTWSIAGGLQHDFDLPGGSTVTARIQSKFQSASNFSFYNFADMRQGANVMSDAFLTYTAPDARWSVTAYVKNLENSRVFSDAEQSQYALAYAYEYFPPRTYGLRAQVNW